MQLGLGSDRRADLEGLRRMHAHLAPGGVLAFDVHLPNQKGSGWRRWLVGEKPELPTRSEPQRATASATRSASGGSPWAWNSALEGLDVRTST